MRLWCVLALSCGIAATLAGCADDHDGPLPSSGQQRIYVVQNSGESLGEIDISTGMVNDHVLDLGLWCNDIVKHGSKLYVANSGDNTIQEIDAETNSTLRTIPVVEGVNPWTIAFVNDDTIAVSCLVTRNVVIMRLSDGATVLQLPLSTAPEGLVVRDGKLIVCETGWLYPDYHPGVIRSYDCSSWQLTDTIAVGINAQFAAVDSLDRLHVVCTGDFGGVPGAIYVLDAETLDLIQTVNTGGTPNTVSFGGGFGYVAAGGFGGSGLVYRYRLSDLSIVNDWNNPIPTGSGVMDVEAIVDGSFFVSCSEADEVRYYDATDSLRATYLVGDGPGYLIGYP